MDGGLLDATLEAGVTTCEHIATDEDAVEAEGDEVEGEENDAHLGCDEGSASKHASAMDFENGWATNADAGGGAADAQALLARPTTTGEDRGSGTTPSLVHQSQGWDLHLSSKSSTGYLGVSRDPNDRGLFRAIVSRQNLGKFETAVEAAVAVARANGNTAGESQPSRPKAKQAAPRNTVLPNTATPTCPKRGLVAGAHVRVYWEHHGKHHGKHHTGKVTEVMAMIGDFRFRVSYDDGTSNWHLLSEMPGMQILPPRSAAAMPSLHAQQLATRGEKKSHNEKKSLYKAKEDDPMTAEDPMTALRLAEAEGLELERSPRASSGYVGVSVDKTNRSHPFRAKSCGANLGSHTTAAEAALAVAKHLAAQQGEGMGKEEEEKEEEKEEEEDEAEEEEAEDQTEVVAEALGWKLHLSNSTPTGYKYVTKQSGGNTFRARVKAPNYSANFASAVEAAIAVAKHLSANRKDNDEQEELAGEPQGEAAAAEGNTRPRKRRAAPASAAGSRCKAARPTSTTTTWAMTSAATAPAASQTQPAPPFMAASAQTQPARNNLLRLTEIKDALNMGLLTQQEFDMKRSEIISEM